MMTLISTGGIALKVDAGTNIKLDQYISMLDEEIVILARDSDSAAEEYLIGKSDCSYVCLA
jgi:hypothetical protein